MQGVTVEGTAAAATAMVVAQGRVQLSDAQLVRGGDVQEAAGATLHTTVAAVHAPAPCDDGGGGG